MNADIQTGMGTRLIVRCDTPRIASTTRHLTTVHRYRVILCCTLLLVSYQVVNCSGHKGGSRIIPLDISAALVTKAQTTLHSADRLKMFLASARVFQILITLLGLPGQAGGVGTSETMNVGNTAGKGLHNQIAHHFIYIQALTLPVQMYMHKLLQPS